MYATFLAEASEAVRFPLPPDVMDAITKVCKLLEGSFFGDSLEYQSILATELTACPPSCGRVFSRGELIYHCRDCAIDETCVLCSECFQSKDHLGHSFRYYLSRGAGGSCDCGEHESWKKTLSCPKHKVKEDVEKKKAGNENENDNDNDSDKGESNFSKNFDHKMRILVGLMEDLIGTSLDGIKRKDEIALVLYNDEKHFFDEVIQLVCQATGSDKEYGQRIATLVDIQGFAVIKTFPEWDILKDKANTAKDILCSTGLEARFESFEEVETKMVLNAIMYWLNSIAQKYPFLRPKILSALVVKKIPVVRDSEGESYRTFAYGFFEKDVKLWKWIRKNFQDLLTLGLAYQDVKVSLMELFGELTGKNIFNETKHRNREPQLSILNFAVQIFTVPSIAQLAINGETLSNLYYYLGECLLGFVSHLGESRKQQGFLSGIHHLVQSIGYITNDEAVVAKELAQNPKYWYEFFKAIISIQDDLIVHRRLGEHVHYEDPSWIQEANLSLSIINMIREFSQTFNRPKVVLDCLNSIFKLLETNYLFFSDLVVPGETFSFQQPIMWFVGGLLCRYSDLAGGEIVPQKVPKIIFSRLSLCLKTFAEFKADLWIRNGVQVTGQATIALSGMGCFDYYLITLWHVIASDEPDKVYEMLKGILFGWNCEIQGESQSELFNAAFDGFFMKTFCGLPASFDKKESLRVAIIQALAIGPASHSELCKRLRAWTLEETFFEETIKAVSLTKEADSPLCSAIKYHLREECVQEYTPFYWNYLDKDRETSIEYLHHQFSYKLLPAMLEKAHPNAPFFSNFFHSSHGKTFVEELAATIFSQSMSQKVFEEFIVLLGFIMQAAKDFQISFTEDQADIILKKCRQFDDAVVVKAKVFSLLSKVSPGIKIPITENSEADKPQDKAKRLAEERRRNILESMKASQLAFETTNVDALTPINAATEELCSLVESGNCVLCQEPAGTGTLSYGVIAVKESLKLGDVIGGGDDGFGEKKERGGVFPFLTGCFHVIHDQCFKRLGRGDPSMKDRCPLCSFPVRTIWPVPFAFPTISKEVDFLQVAQSVTSDDYSIFIFEKMAAQSSTTLVYDEGVFHLEKMYKAFDEPIDPVYCSPLALAEGCCRNVAALDGTPEAINAERSARFVLSYLYGLGDNYRSNMTVNRRAILDQLLDSQRSDLVIKEGPKLSTFQLFMAIFAQFYSPASITTEDRIKQVICLVMVFTLNQVNILCCDTLNWSPERLYNEFDTFMGYLARHPTLFKEVIEVAQDHLRVIITFLNLWFGIKIPLGENLLKIIFGEEFSIEENLMRNAQGLLTRGRMTFRLFKLPQALIKTINLRPLKFIDLPLDYSELFLKFQQTPLKKCKACRGETSAVCLVCDTWVCSNSYYCNEDTLHIHQCTNSQGMLLDAMKCAIILVAIDDGGGQANLANRKKLVPAPYVDDHGEADLGFKNGGPLTLLPSRYQYLYRFYLSGSIRSFIYRNYGNHII